MLNVPTAVSRLIVIESYLITQSQAPAREVRHNMFANACEHSQYCIILH